jgi:uncharacterized membrane protein YphA (DoxX/SURF4 family)
MNENRIQQESILKIALTILRVLVGWHFLYEGLSKLATPGWSCASYLMESKWLFSGFFHWIISSSSALAVADFLNIWGLILIGLGLFFNEVVIGVARKAECLPRYRAANA